MATHELGERLHDDIRAVIDRTQQDRCRDGVVDDERYAMAMRDGGESRDIRDVAGRVADALAEERLGVAVDQRFHRGGAVVGGETRVDALPRKDVREQRVRRAIELRHGHDVTAAIGEVDDGIVQRGLTGAGGERGDSALERGDTTLQHIDRRIGDAAVAIAGCL